MGSILIKIFSFLEYWDRKYLFCLKTDFRCNRSNTYIFIQWFPIHATSTVSSNKSREMHLSRLLKPQIYDRYFVLSTFPFYFITLWTDLNIRKLRFSKVHWKQMIQSTAIFQKKNLKNNLKRLISEAWKALQWCV